MPLNKKPKKKANAPGTLRGLCETMYHADQIRARIMGRPDELIQGVPEGRLTPERVLEWLDAEERHNRDFLDQIALEAKKMAAARYENRRLAVLDWQKEIARARQKKGGDRG